MICDSGVGPDRIRPSLRYFVIAPDGSKYGPADIQTLRAWMIEGRIAATTMLEEEGTRRQVQAQSVIKFGEAPTFNQPSVPYVRKPEFAPRGDQGNGDIVLSYICSALTILCCCFFNVGSFIYANRAISKGHPKGNTARVVAIVALILWIITTLITIPFLGKLKDWTMQQVNQAQQQSQEEPTGAGEGDKGVEHIVNGGG
jgi:hypothetical protein